MMVLMPVCLIEHPCGEYPTRIDPCRVDVTWPFLPTGDSLERYPSFGAASILEPERFVHRHATP